MPRATDLVNDGGERGSSEAATAVRARDVEGDHGRDWSLRDLLFCVVAPIDHDGDLEAVADSFVGALRSHGHHDRGANEAKLNHLTDLRAHIRDANLIVAGPSNVYIPNV